MSYYTARFEEDMTVFRGGRKLNEKDAQIARDEGFIVSPYFGEEEAKARILEIARDPKTREFHLFTHYPAHELTKSTKFFSCWWTEGEQGWSVGPYVKTGSAFHLEKFHRITLKFPSNPAGGTTKCDLCDSCDYDGEQRSRLS